MQVKTIHTGPIETNTYLFECGDKVAVVDPGANPEGILKAAEDTFQKPVAFVLLTHAHWDHTDAVKALKDLTGATVYMHETDARLIASNCRSSAQVFIPDVFIKDGEELNLNGTAVKVLHTPGHTAGSVCYIAEDCMFSGDTLFHKEIGRCDLPTGDFSAMKKTLKKLFALEPDYTVLPGHGMKTSLGFEKVHNPYV